jgi:hypothetical protein
MINHLRTSLKPLLPQLRLSCPTELDLAALRMRSYVMKIPLILTSLLN